MFSKPVSVQPTERALWHQPCDLLQVCCPNSGSGPGGGEDRLYPWPRATPTRGRRSIHQAPGGLKRRVSRDCSPLFVSGFEPIWAPDKHNKVFSNSFLISPRYSNFKKHPTAESISPVYIMHRRAKPHTAESKSKSLLV